MINLISEITFSTQETKKQIEKKIDMAYYPPLQDAGNGKFDMFAPRRY